MQVTNNSSPDPDIGNGWYSSGGTLYLGVNGITGTVADAFNYTTPRIYEVDQSANGKLSIDDVNKISLTNTAPSHSGKYLRLWSYYQNTWKTDWILVRRYASSDPTGSFGSEQNN